MFKLLVRFLKSFFNKPKPIPTQLPHQSDQDVTPNNPKKVAIIVGHTKKSQGAVAYTGEPEWAFNNDVAIKTKELLKVEKEKDIRIFYRKDGLGYKSAMQDLAKRVKAWGAEFSIELHFNSFERKAYGCEILVANDAPQKDYLMRIADQITDDLAEEFNLRERYSVKYDNGTYGDGVKLLSYGERGYHNLGYLGDHGIPAILIEPMFANKKTSESEQFFEVDGKQRYAQFLANAIDGI